jgi:putative PIN family toxin of toxin-antitoxin system
MRLVLDTSVLVAAIRSNRGRANRLLVAALRRRCVPLASVPLMLEYEAVLTRPEHLSASGLTSIEVGVVLDALAAVAEPVRLNFLWRPLLPDPDDDMVLETAVNGRADAIATFNRRDFSRSAPRFGIAVRTPGDCLQELSP